MARLLRISGLYTAIVFLLGFAMGALRIFFLAPVIGDLAAVAVEIPIMLAFSALVAARVVRLSAPLSIGDGIEIGLFSFLFLQIAESLLAGLFGPYVFVDNMLVYWSDLTPPRLLGLFGQALFALLPLFHILRSHRHER
ncbi:hypothetical protein [Rhizobium alvei]|uniref:Uncharacterized protein n=1 Tax=Rhizobium alvei TaxID=1132659 RepID=A0ABT8YMP2_9HYPH|nr:hypothetical protein [Rhizobium alvei]MDO6964495.1 hypothetical protein [Rhizobium alvei]